MSLLRCVVDVDTLYGVDFEPAPEIDVGSVPGANVGPMPGHDIECDLRKDRSFFQNCYIIQVKTNVCLHICFDKHYYFTLVLLEEICLRSVLQCERRQMSE